MNLSAATSEKTCPSPFKTKIDLAALAKKILSPSAGRLLRISSLLNDINSSPTKITEAVSYEPTLVTYVLRLANSPIYSLERKVTSVQAAINTVGNERLREISMMVFGSISFGNQMSKSPLARKLWEHSIAVAIVSRELSAGLRMQGNHEAFTCGLLHDIGKLLLLSNDFKNYSTILQEENEDRIMELERQEYGYSHDEIGGLVARHWGLVDEVCNVIRHHHDPFASDQPMMVAHVIKVANSFAQDKGYGWQYENAEDISKSQSAIILGLNADDLENAWSKGQASLDDAIKMLS